MINLINAIVAKFKHVAKFLMGLALLALVCLFFYAIGFAAAHVVIGALIAMIKMTVSLVRSLFGAVVPSTPAAEPTPA